MKRSFLISTLLICVLANSTLLAQIFTPVESEPEYSNYVPNSSFEDIVRTYCRWNQNGRKYMEDINSWDSPTETTPDILSMRAKSSCWSNPRIHSNGKQSPRSGDNMAGIKTYGKGGTETFWHEYVMVKLDSTLQPGIKYYAEFYALRSVRSELGSNNIGLAVSDTAITTRDRMPLFLNPVINAQEVVKSRWNFWKKISGVFEVNEEMNYILIGNFYHDNKTEISEFPEGEGGAYYYIDDVTVRRAKPGENLSARPPRSIPPPPKIILQKAEIVSTKEIKLDSIDYKVGNTITLDNIEFEFDKATLLPRSKMELNKLVDIMTDYPHLGILIGGHTDNVGSDEYNMNLSKLRAKSVLDYLIERNVEPHRLKYEGYGSSRPIASNSTDQGRAINRRVTFTVIRN
jgi:outer membrane protein OmpA-like peptidoglycan-associated protein